MKYRLNPVLIEGILWDGTQSCLAQIQTLIQNATMSAATHVPSNNTFVFQTLEGTLIAQVGDYVVRGVAGEVYPVKQQIFAMMATKAE
jgi:ATP-dependent Clp protease protease subunit